MPRITAWTEQSLRSPPASAIAPGADATIEARWHFAVPRVDTLERGERMGRFGDYLYQVAQWYPQVAMYDDMRGWDTDQYTGIGEFYNQFGSYDVRITVSGGWLVGATGDLQNPSDVLSQLTRDRLALAMRADTTAQLAFDSYARQWRFKHPSPYDFFLSMNRSLDRNLDWFWYQWCFTTFTVDQTFQSVTKPGANAIVTIRDNGDMAMTIPLRGKSVKTVALDPDNHFQDLDRNNNVWNGTR